MKDRIPQYPGRVKLVPVAGIADTYDMTRADDPIEPGTPLNKATLLTDETANLIWPDATSLPDNPTVNKALEVFGKTPGHQIGDIATTIRTDLGADWLLCNGEEVSENEYPELCALLGKKGLDRPWTTVSNYVSGTFYAVKAIYAAGTYVILGNSSNTGNGTVYIAYSTDGETWTKKQICSSRRAFDIAYGNGQWVIVMGNNGSTGLSPLYIRYSSTLGGTWTDKTLTSSNFRPNRIQYVGDYFVITTSTGHIYFASTPEGTWETKPVANSYAIYDILHVNNLWYCSVASRGGSKVAYASNLSGTWTLTNTSIGGTEGISVPYLAYSDGFFYAMGCTENPPFPPGSESGKVYLYRTTDPVNNTWKELYTNISVSNPKLLIIDNNIYVIGTGNTVHSPDFVNVFSYPVGPALATYSVLYHNGQLLSPSSESATSILYKNTLGYFLPKMDGLSSGIQGVYAYIKGGN